MRIFWEGMLKQITTGLVLINTLTPPVKIYNIKILYWILYYVIVAWNFVSYPFPCVLRQIPVFTCWFICVTFLMIHLLSPIFSYSIWSSQILFNTLWLITFLSGGLLPLYVILSVRQGGGTKLEVWIESNGCVRVCVHDTILARNNTAPNIIMIPMPTLVPRSTMDLGIKLHRVPCNMTLQPQLQSSR